jgi:hypothetical protein
MTAFMCASGNEFLLTNWHDFVITRLETSANLFHWDEMQFANQLRRTFKCYNLD